MFCHHEKCKYVGFKVFGTKSVSLLETPRLGGSTASILAAKVLSLVPFSGLREYIILGIVLGFVRATFDGSLSSY